MAISNELLHAGLIDAGVPETLASRSAQDIDDESLKTKYLLTSDLMQTKPVIFVYGVDSPVKELVCVKLMRRYMFRNDKTGRWLTPARISYHEPIRPAGVITVVGLDLLTPPQTKILSQVMRDWLPMGRAFILSTSSPDNFKEIFGSDLHAYISHYGTELKVNVPPVKMAVAEE